MLVPTTCFNCESACGLLAYVDRDTRQVRKFEGNPEHPGSRGRNCAKGPATLNQVTDPDRILYPLKRAGAPRRGPVGAGQLGRGARRASRRGSGRRSPRAARTRSWYHIGRPGEDGFTERVLASWGVDGHNSHTNVCSQRRPRPASSSGWASTGPARTTRNAKVIYLISAHLEAGHYFNPHAQRIIEAKAERRQGHRAGHPAVEHRHPRRLLAVAAARQRGRDQPGHRQPPDPTGPLRRATSSAAGGTGRSTCAECRPDLPGTFEAFQAVLAELYAEFTFEFAARRVGRRRRGARRGRRGRRRRRARGSPATSWRSAAAGNLGGWQVSRTPVPVSTRCSARSRTEGGTFPNAWNKFVPRPIHSPPHPGRLARADLAGGVPAGPERDVVPAAALAQGRPRQARHLLHPRLQPGVDQPGRAVSWMEVLTDEQKVGLLRRADADLERVRLLRRLRAADGARLRAARHPLLRAVRRRSGSGSASRSCARPASGSARRSPTPARSTPARCGRRTSSGSSCPGGSTRTARSASGSTTSRAPARATKLTVDEYYGWMFEHSVPGPARAGGGRGPARRWSGCAATAPSRSAAARARVHEQEVPAAELADVGRATRHRAGCTRPRPRRPRPTSCPMGAPGPDDQGRRPVGVLVDGGRPPRLPDPVRAAGVLVLDAGRLGLAGARAARLHQEPRAPVGAGPRPGGAAVHVPAADADPHPLGQRQVAGRARPHQPGLDPPDATRPGSGWTAPATWSGWRPRSATSWPRRGSPRASGRAWWRASTTWAAGSSAGTARSARAA